jgi:hypothetical protein
MIFDRREDRIGSNALFFRCGNLPGSLWHWSLLAEG